MQNLKSLITLVVVLVLGAGLLVGFRKLWRKHEVASRFTEFQTALEVNELRDLYKFLPPAIQVAMPYESFEKELLDAKDRVRVREVTLDKIVEKQDPRRPRAEVTFTIQQEELKTGKKTQIQLAYDWIKLRGEWYVSLRSIQERYGQYMGEDNRFRGMGD